MSILRPATCTSPGLPLARVRTSSPLGVLCMVLPLGGAPVAVWGPAAAAGCAAPPGAVDGRADAAGAAVFAPAPPVVVVACPAVVVVAPDLPEVVIPLCPAVVVVGP